MSTRATCPEFSAAVFQFLLEILHSFRFRSELDVHANEEQHRSSSTVKLRFARHGHR